MIMNPVRDLLQLHHVHGGELRGDDHHDPQLPPQAGGHPHHAHLGESMFNEQILFDEQTNCGRRFLKIICPR